MLMMPKSYFRARKNESKREVVPIFDHADDNTNNINDIIDKETEKK